MTYFGANPSSECPATSQALQLWESRSSTGSVLRGPVTGAQRDSSISSPPVIPSGEIGLAGGSGCSRLSDELTEQISPTSWPGAFLHGAL